ncbi:MAG: CCA tRNA nucleotidyltransferase [Roseburia sp.]|nr:CCA tRNA nucleotidyltransferase [Roseburia sp.]
MSITIPGKANYIINTLEQAGFEAYVVGGCVRDSILGRKPQDWDITTSALPNQVKALFPRTIDTGIQHGTVTVMLNREGFEVTTYRIDGTYEDSRHPKEVLFTPCLEEDLKRRDFTINAMAYNGRVGLVDIFGGMEDMENQVIRCVGQARERFQEDALRIMRAVRFSAQLGYEIEEGTKEAIRELAPRLKNISAERIQMELTKLMMSGHPEYLKIAWETGITGVILPEFDRMMETPQNHPHHQYNVGEHTLAALSEVMPVKSLRLAMLLHDIGKPDTKETDDEGRDHFHGHAAVGEELAGAVLRRLKYDNDTIYRVCRLVRYHDYGNDMEPDKRIVRRTMNKIGEEFFPDIFYIKRADILAQSDFMRREKLDRLAKWQQIYEEIAARKQCVSLKNLAVTGKDLIALGMKPGKEIGSMLQELLEIVLDNPQYNTKEYLLKEAERLGNCEAVRE